MSEPLRYEDLEERLRFPGRQRLQGTCAAAIPSYYMGRYSRCSKWAKKGDEFCSVHAAMRDKHFTPSLKKHSKERLDAARRVPNTPEFFHFWERWKEWRR